MALIIGLNGMRIWESDYDDSRDYKAEWKREREMGIANCNDDPECKKKWIGHCDCSYCYDDFMERLNAGEES